MDRTRTDNTTGKMTSKFVYNFETQQLNIVPSSMEIHPDNEMFVPLSPEETEWC